SYIPMAFLDSETIASDLCLIIPKATHYHFGVLSSVMHMAWVRYVAGRLKSDFRYSNQIVYNNFPWPLDPTDKQVQSVEVATDAVLAAREKFPDASLADLYDPVTMPPTLREAHAKLDRAVDAAYACPEPGRRGKRSFASEADRIAFLFDLYNQYTTLLPAVPKPRRRARRKPA
ncbi:MAG: type IIL restriction-modification enzyme MmeI, partial [Gammaproteobacteria bacterium]